jgi:hypothetical protein
MIFGIRLKHFSKLVAQGENLKSNFWINRLLLKTSNKKFKVNNIEDLTFSDFVDAERYLEEQNYYDFCCIFVKSKRIYIHNMPSILHDYKEQKEILFDKFQYIFNPPQYGEPVKETIGSDLRKEFVQEFGNWVILTDVICKGRLVDYKKVESWKLGEFLFWANYLSGQKIIENVK